MGCARTDLGHHEECRGPRSRYRKMAATWWSPIRRWTEPTSGSGYEEEHGRRRELEPARGAVRGGGERWLPLRSRSLPTAHAPTSCGPGPSARTGASRSPHKRDWDPGPARSTLRSRAETLRPRTLSADGQRATAVWQRFDGAHQRIQSSSSQDGGATWTRPDTHSGSGSTSDNPRVATSPEGDAVTLVWYRQDPGNNVIESVSSADAGQTWGPVTPLSDDAQPPPKILTSAAPWMGATCAPGMDPTKPRPRVAFRICARFQTPRHWGHSRGHTGDRLLDATRRRRGLPDHRLHRDRLAGRAVSATPSHAPSPDWPTARPTP